MPAIEMFESCIGALQNYLPSEEANQLLTDPNSFTSQNFLFRGLDESKLQRLQEERCMKPEMGQYGSRAVFMTDNPLNALSYINGSGALVIMRKDAAQTVYGKIFAHSDGEYKAMVAEYIQSCPESEKNNTAYEAQNIADVTVTASQTRPWKNVELRLPQPLHAIEAIIKVSSKPQTFAARA